MSAASCFCRNTETFLAQPAGQLGPSIEFACVGFLQVILPQSKDWIEGVKIKLHVHACLSNVNRDCTFSHVSTPMW